VKYWFNNSLDSKLGLRKIMKNNLHLKR
jgi:hypothetical protein